MMRTDDEDRNEDRNENDETDFEMKGQDTRTGPFEDPGMAP